MKKVLVFSLLCYPAWGHTQGIGDFPFRSTWMAPLKKTMAIYRPIYDDANSTAITSAMVYWFFPAPPTPPSTVLKDRIGRGNIPFRR